jgi:HEAT repeat protein
MKTTIAIITSAWLLAGVAPAAFAWPGMDASEKEKARLEREEDLYDDATDALDERDWHTAAKVFLKVADMKLRQADAALYWRSYAQHKMGQRAEALATLVELQKSYPNSKWASDGKQLELEIRQSAGQTVEPQRVEDIELKLMAINGLMQTDAERAIPILERLLQSNNPQKIKDRAMFVLSQSDSQKAFDVLARIAKGGTPDLQSLAVRYLGIAGGERNRQLLADIYATSNDLKTKKSVLKAFMISGDKARVLALAKTETNPELRADAVTQLGVMGARNELSELYNSETTIEVKKKIIQAMFIGGNADKLAELARNEPVLELKLAAIKNLGLIGGGRSGELLHAIYRSDTRPEIRSVVINAFFIQGNAKTLVDLARNEKDPELKKRIIQKLSIMGSKDATDYLMEYLKD